MIERFMSRVVPEPNSGCWLWDGAVFGNGYGTLSVKNRQRLAHRVSYELHCGPVPDGLHVLHSCDVRCCVNPQHLRVGTDADNARDKVVRGRARGSRLAGEKHPNARFTATDIAAIRSSPDTQAALAARYGTSQGYISNIRKGRCWSQPQAPA